MAKIIEEIVNLVYTRTGGFIRLSPEIAADIVTLCAAFRKEQPTPYIKFFQYRPSTDSYEFIRVIPVTQEQIDKQIKYALDIGPTYHFCMYHLYNISGESEGQIYSLNASLF